MRALSWCVLVILASSCGDVLPAYQCVQAIDGPAQVNEIASIDTVVYVAAFQSVSVYDVSDSKKLKVLPSLPAASAVMALATGGARLVVALATNLSVYDASTPSAQVLLGTLNNTISTVSARAMATDGHWVYAGKPNGGIVVYDISSGTPVVSTVISDGGGNVVLNGKALYSTRGSLFVTDVSDPAHPISKPPVERQGLSLETLNMHGGVLYGFTPVLGASSDSWGVAAFDVSNSLVPKISDEVVALRVSGTVRQSAWLHGFLFSSGSGTLHATHVGSGTTPNAANMGQADTGIYDPQSTACTVRPNTLRNVHAVGETIVSTGGTFTIFWAPR